MNLSYKFRLYPTKEQENALLEVLELCRWLYNYFLGIIKCCTKVPSRTLLQEMIPGLCKKHPKLSRVHSKTRQYVLYQLYSNLKSLSGLKRNGRRVGSLRFKGKGWYKTFVYNQSGFKLMRTGKRLDLLYLSKIGTIPIRLHRSPNGKVKQVVVKREGTGKWFATIQAESKIEPLLKRDRTVGIDEGIESYVVDSDGNSFENPKLMDKIFQRIKTVQQELSRKRRGSKNREKWRMKLARLYEKLKNQRNDFLHKLSKYYIENYDAIAIETLNIKEMVENGDNKTLNRHISDASWGSFIQMLAYKAERAGRQLISVDPKKHKPTQTCARCGRRHPMSLKTRVFRCPYCGWECNRDLNSSLVVEKAGMGQPSEPVERKPLLRPIAYRKVVSGQVFSMKQEAPCVSVR